MEPQSSLPPPDAIWTDSSAHQPVAPAGRVRAGALGANAQKYDTKLVASAHCQCCPALVEDDANAVAGCPDTGSDACASFVASLWLRAGATQVRRSVGCSARVLDPTAFSSTGGWPHPVLLAGFCSRR